ncbi:hypothetical protein SASPL_150080 [Salvia splendens]|uniref:Myb/SANT-like domain-containing protein n=1 Tax=Salvia splendens TaxID=180675 RepID=A0A8X8Z254_SALSN|nr:hypothetical protein SASPL_150080 [Salvia splendens]
MPVCIRFYTLMSVNTSKLIHGFNLGNWFISIISSLLLICLLINFCAASHTRLLSSLSFAVMASQHQSGNNTDDSPLPEGSSDMVTNKRVIAAVARRCWTEREEAILMSAMKELVATRWKSDNGFRSGYLTRALEALKREFPKTDIVVHPHIKSKITSWKKNYYSLMQILDRSRVSFNADGEYKIDIDDEQWAQVVPKDSNAKYMRNKSWPMLSDWKEIFGKDRAEGVKGMDTREAVQKIYGSNVAVEHFGTAPVRVTPRVQNKVPKKRKAEDKMDNVLALMNRIREDTNERLKDISTRIGYEFDLSTKRTEVFNQLKGMPGLTIKQQFYAAKKLVNEPELMDLFKGLDEWARPAFVLNLLETDGMI